MCRLDSCSPLMVPSASDGAQAADKLSFEFHLVFITLNDHLYLVAPVMDSMSLETGGELWVKYSWSLHRYAVTCPHCFSST